jgi:hypothetical protein
MKNFLAGTLGVLVMLAAIYLGFGLIVAPLFIIAFIIFMVSKG